MFLIMLIGHCQGKKKKVTVLLVLFLLTSQILKFGGSFNSLLHPVFFCIFYVVGCSPVVLTFVSTHFQVLFLPSMQTLQPLPGCHAQQSHTNWQVQMVFLCKADSQEPF